MVGGREPGSQTRGFRKLVQMSEDSYFEYENSGVGLLYQMDRDQIGVH